MRTQETIQIELTNLKEGRNKKSQELATLEAGGAVGERTKQLRTIEAELLRIQKEHWTQTANKIQSAKVELRKLEDDLSTLVVDTSHKRKQLTDNQEEIAKLDRILGSLRQKWQENNARELPLDSGICPTCRQSLPADQVEAARAEFNVAKANELEAINEEGRALKNEMAELQIEITKLEQDSADKTSQQAKLEEPINGAKATIASLEKQEADYAAAPAYIAMGEKKAGIELEIEKLKATNSGAADAMKLIIFAIDTKIAECERTIAQIEQRENGLKRIEELGKQEKMLAKEYEELESQLYLCETFIRTKVGMLESRVNGMFSLTKWKLFDTQVNQAITECCDATYLGVPYSNLNHGAQINIGLDILKTLQKHYGFQCPVWIDRRESVTKLLDMACQVISLIVSEADKVLRVEKAKEAVKI